MLLIDLSSLLYAAWYTSGSEPNPDATATKTMDRVHVLSHGHDRVVICCDVGGSFRKEISPEYKKNREEKPEALIHQYKITMDRLKSEGYEVVGAYGYEADDCIATLVTHARAQMPPVNVLIATADKDLLQLVGDGVAVWSTSSNRRIEKDDVIAKFGVRPDQILDYLCLVGDNSDNVIGVRGIGAVRACAILGKFETLDKAFCSIVSQSATDLDISPGVYAALKAGRQAAALARRLITLQRDVPLYCTQFSEMSTRGEIMNTIDDTNNTEKSDTLPPDCTPIPPPQIPVPPLPPLPPSYAAPVHGAHVGLTRVTSCADMPDADKSAMISTSFERALEPQNAAQAVRYSDLLFASRLFSGYGTKEGVLSTILIGRELGIGMMAALRGVHIVEGKHTLSADLMAALVLRSGVAEYFCPVELSETQATYETRRKGAKNSLRMSFSTADADRAGLVRDKGSWKKYGGDMCRARAIARLARTVYPDVCFGLYTPEEISES